MPTTTKGFRYPASTDAVNVPGDIQNVASDIDTWLTSNVAPLTLTTNAQTGTAYTLVLADSAKSIEMNNASANTLTVPPNSSVAFPVGTSILITQTGAGQTTVAAGAGVTINSNGAKLKLNGQWAQATLLKRATDTWVISGLLSA